MTCRQSRVAGGIEKGGGYSELLWYCTPTELDSHKNIQIHFITKIFIFNNKVFFFFLNSNDNQERSSSIVKQRSGSQSTITICVLVALHVSRVTFTTSSGAILYTYTKIIRHVSYNYEIKRTYISQILHNSVSNSIIQCNMLSSCCGCPPKRSSHPERMSCRRPKGGLAHFGGLGSS